VDERDRRIAALERDLEALRARLAGYVDERAVAEAALAESEARYRQLIDRAAFGIYRASATGRFLEANAALVAMLGYASVDELRDVDIGRDVYSDAAERDAVLASIRAGAPVDWLQVRWRRKDGSPITVRLSARLVRDDEGRELYCEAIAEDVTERNRRDELLRRSERMASLGHTLAGVAHELNNPLAAVSGFAQLMLREARSEDDRTALETINREATRAGKIVKDLLTFARRQEAHPHEPVYVAEVARHIFATQRYAMETRGIRHELVAERDLPPVLADAAQIEQVLLNLVVNARDAMPGGGLIRITTDACELEPGSGAVADSGLKPGRYVRMSVQDEGVGMDPATQARIFEPFFSTREPGRGTGLGLSTVYGIVRQTGGAITVQSERGKGASFKAYLPAVAGE
jgi:PAS domain S-box-containing protein